MSKPDIRRPKDIDARWLTAVLREGGVDADVKDFTAKNVGTGQIGESVRFALEYARDADGAPRSIVGKFPSPGDESRSAGVSLGNYRREVKFYQNLAASALISTPRCYFTDVDEATHEFVLMMEDLAPAEQGDQLVGVSVETAGIVIDEAAKLHASHWRDDGLNDHDWVNNTPKAAKPISPEMVAGLWGAFVARYGERVTAEARHIGETMIAKFDINRVKNDRPRCLTHNDFRPDNMMFATPAGGKPITVLDWQSIGYGTGATDVAYFLGGAITPEERRANETQLLNRYLDGLEKLGVTGYAYDDLVHDYGAGSFQLFITAFFAAMVVTQTARGDDMFFCMLNGATAQIMDHDALKYLD
jgi:hypothetical protein